MEMEDAVSDDADDTAMAEVENQGTFDVIVGVWNIEPDQMQDFRRTGLISIPGEGIFRAGTPTPTTTPLIPQAVVPQNGAHDGIDLPPASLAVAAAPMTDIHGTEIRLIPASISRAIFGPDDDIDLLNDLTGIPREISTEELDTECLSL
jgi:hypothetical protein